MLLAYKYVALTVLIAEANFNAERLNLPINRPVVESQLTFTLIAPTNILEMGGFMGSIHAQQYAFSEGGGNHYRLVAKLDSFGGLSSAEQNEMLSHEKSLITTNQAYQLATNWLTLIDVNVRELETTNKWEVQQRWYYGNHDEQILLPVFFIKWGDWNEPKVDVSIDGRTKQFIELMQLDDSFSRRPQELIRDWKGLLAISDEEFLKYSPLQRSNRSGGGAE
jgi:hypothetical protein